MSSDLKDISLCGAELEPMMGGLVPYPKGPALFSANTREKLDRRQTEDRRLELRFEGNRRNNNDRRPLNTWGKGHKL